VLTKFGDITHGNISHVVLQVCQQFPDLLCGCSGVEKMATVNDGFNNDFLYLYSRSHKPLKALVDKCQMVLK
jgi:hypothetical protein